MADEQFPAAATALEEYRPSKNRWQAPKSCPTRTSCASWVVVTPNWVPSWVPTSWLQVKDDLAAAQEMAGEDADFAEEAKRLEDELPGVEEKLRTALIPRAPG